VPTAAGGCGSWPAWGHDEAAKQTYLGLRAHLRVPWPGAIVQGRLGPANASDLAVGAELLAEAAGWVLADRLKQVWARDAWHLWSRWLRKLLSHTRAVLLCQQAGLPPLRFAQLITA
jgi:hypothetical protein